jgi:integrase
VTMIKSDRNHMNDLIKSYVTYLKSGGRSEQTIRDRQKLLRRLDRELPEGLDAFSTQDLEQWLAPYAGWTLYTYHSAIRDFCRFAITAGHEFDASADLAQPKAPDNEPRPATAGQVQKALAMLTGVPLTAVTLAAFNGLRCAEIGGLLRSHVTAETLWVSRKGSKTQLLPTHPRVWELLRNRPAGLIVTTCGGQQFAPNYLSTVVSEALTAIGMADLTLHRFRATFATRLAMAGVHVTVIQDLMGHRSVVSTQRYIKVSSDQRRDAISALMLPN